MPLFDRLFLVVIGGGFFVVLVLVIGGCCSGGGVFLGECVIFGLNGNIFIGVIFD